MVWQSTFFNFGLFDLSSDLLEQMLLMLPVITSSICEDGRSEVTTDQWNANCAASPEMMPEAVFWNYFVELWPNTFIIIKRFYAAEKSEGRVSKLNPKVITLAQKLTSQTQGSTQTYKRKQLTIANAHVSNKIPSPSRFPSKRLTSWWAAIR